MFCISSFVIDKEKGKYMGRLSKRVFSAVLATGMVFSLAGCGSAKNNTREQATVDKMGQELQQNDYRGGIIRTLTLKDSVLNVMEEMKSNNTIIRESSPNSYWTADGYQDFVSTFLDTSIISDTQWFNEEETDWETVISQMITEIPSFSDGNGGLSVTVLRNEKDDYSINNAKITDNKLEGTGELTANYKILYDCDKDWCKSYITATVDKSLPDITTQLFEYQRIDDNTFAIQTNRERLVVVLKPVGTESVSGNIENTSESETGKKVKKADKTTEATTESKSNTPYVDMRNREIKEFYYSKLVQDGMRSTFVPYAELPEVDDATATDLNANIKQNELMAKYPFMNEYGDVAFYYGEKNSMFFNSPSEINEKWVFEDKALQQAIVYKDGVLVATTYNKLSDSYERFVYARSDADSSIIKDLENMVVINSLVGVVEEAETSNLPEDNAYDGASTEETDNIDTSDETATETDNTATSEAVTNESGE